MAPVSPGKQSDQEKLDILQRLDQFRFWHSLDEKRYCLVCGKIITGREIQVIGSTRDNGALRIICPTENCNSIPMDWVRPTDEVLIKTAMAEAEGPNDSRQRLPELGSEPVTKFEILTFTQTPAQRARSISGNAVDRILSD